MHLKEEITVSLGAPSSRWITFKARNVLLVFAVSHLMCWELPGHDICNTLDLLHPHRPPRESNESEGLHVSPPSLVNPASSCPPLMKNITSATSHMEKSFLNTSVSFSFMCLLPFPAQFVSHCTILWWKSLLT